MVGDRYRSKEKIDTCWTGSLWRYWCGSRSGSTSKGSAILTMKKTSGERVLFSTCESFQTLITCRFPHGDKLRKPCYCSRENRPLLFLIKKNNNARLDNVKTLNWVSVCSILYVMRSGLVACTRKKLSLVACSRNESHISINKVPLDCTSILVLMW